MQFPETHPLIRPRLFPIWNRSPWIALTRCRYWRPFTLHRTMSPTFRDAGAIGSTVQSCPDSILPFIDCPRGRNWTVSPRWSCAMYSVAQPIAGSPRGEKRVETRPARAKLGPAASRCYLHEGGLFRLPDGPRLLERELRQPQILGD